MRNSRKIKKLRNKAAQGQQWHCYYCREPMWDGDPTAFGERFTVALRSIFTKEVEAGPMSSEMSSPLATTATGLDTSRNGRKTRHTTRSMSSPEWK